RRPSVLQSPSRLTSSGVLFCRDRPATCRQLLPPFAAVERLDLDGLDRPRIQAARVDAVAIRARARHVERFAAAGRAEKMLRGSGVEGIARQEFLALKQPEARLGHDEMQIPRLGADGAIALGDFEA